MTGTMRPMGDVIGGKALAIAARLAAEAQERLDALAARGEEYIPQYRNALRDDPLMAQQRRRERALPAEYQRMTLESFAPYSNGLTEAYESACRFATEPRGLLYLFGAPGGGKTHLAAGVVMRLADAGRGVRFWRMADLSQRLRDAAVGESHELASLVALLSNVGVLLLDDFPPEHVTPFVYEQLYRILDARYTRRSVTIITSNIEPEALDMPRLSSRLSDRGYATLVPVYADDYRTLAPKPKARHAPYRAALAQPTTELCVTCGGLGIVKRDLPVGHRDFGRAFPCPVCRGGGDRMKNGGEA